MFIEYKKNNFCGIYGPRRPQTNNFTKRCRTAVRLAYIRGNMSFATANKRTWCMRPCIDLTELLYSVYKLIIFNKVGPYGTDLNSYESQSHVVVSSY